MVMRVVVPVVTALIMIVVGVFWMFMMLIGTNGYNSSTGGTILIANGVLVILAVVISSVASGLLAHVIQTRTGMSPWLVGPGTVVAVSAISVIAIFLIGTIIIGVIDSTRKRPAPPQQPPAVNRRGGK